jgi:hypothetical protein
MQEKRKKKKKKKNIKKEKKQPPPAPLMKLSWAALKEVAMRTRGAGQRVTPAHDAPPPAAAGPPRKSVFARLGPKVCIHHFLLKCETTSDRKLIHCHFVPA